MNKKAKLTAIVPIQGNSLINFKPTTGELRYNEPVISRLDGALVDDIILDMISEAYMFCGHRLDEETVKVNLMLFKRVLETYWYITTTELKKAIRNGLEGKYGEYVTPSPKLFTDWLKKYMQNDRNTDLNKLKPKIEEMPELTQEEQDALIYSGVINCFESFKQDNKIVDGYSWVYDHLIDLKLIDPKPEQRKQAYKKAAAELEMIAKNSLPDTRKQIMEQLQMKRAPRAVVMAKIIILEHYFSTLIAKGEHIKEKLN